MKTPPPHINAIEVQDLNVEFLVEGQRLVAVAGSSFNVPTGKTTGLVGESGCGKSVSAFAIMRLIPSPPGKITGGKIIFGGRNLLALGIEEMRKIRGCEIAMIFQEPMTALNPVYTVAQQMAEIYRLHTDSTKQDIRDRCVEMLKQVGIPSPEMRLKDYPHQLSGGMRQRVMIAMALSLSPTVLIADEPTTALDVTIQAQILDLMGRLKGERNMSTLFITHDLGVVAETCDEVVVMYAGKVVEKAPVTEIFKNPLHPYTRGLLTSLPKRGVAKEEKLTTIEGMVPDMFHPPMGCRFADRCSRCEPKCREQEPLLNIVVDAAERKVACWFPL